MAGRRRASRSCAGTVLPVGGALSAHRHRFRSTRLNLELLLLGVALLLVALLDALWTTLWVDGGAGPVTSRVTAWAWRAMLAVVGRSHHTVLSVFGPTILIGTVLLWGLLLWCGWVLVFAGDPGSLLSSSAPRTQADWPGRIWFVAYAISTMGNGDFVPTGDAWKLVASLTTLSGFFLATLSISYLLAVVAAVVEKRAFAGSVAGRGRTGADFLRNAWNGEDFRTLDLPLHSLTDQLGPLTEQYLSYPVLQYYHAAQSAKSPAIAIAVLDDALTLLRFGIPEQIRPNVAVLHSARESVRGYLETLHSASIDPAHELPPPPSLQALREAGIPTVSDEEFSAALGGMSDRRRRLLGLVRDDGWNWSDR